MKLKLTKAEFKALYALFSNMIVAAKPKGMQTKLLHAILYKIYEQMYRKAIKDKKAYSLILETEQELAFWLFFSKFTLPSEMVFETNLIDRINDSIHQKHIS